VTRARAAALDALRASGAPLSATGVMEAMGSCCDQATVYRALGWLEERGLSESFVLRCDAHGTERYWTPSGRGEPGSHRHWFHCRSCHRFIDLGACTLGPLVGRLEAEMGIRVEGHVLYLVGECPACGRGAESGEEKNGADPEGRPRHSV